MKTQLLKSAPLFFLLLYVSECIIVVPEFIMSLCSINYSNKLDSNMLHPLLNTQLWFGDAFDTTERYNTFYIT